MNNVCKKVVLLVRASTEEQETESQKNELIKLCEQEGYTLDEMYIIVNKESASKSNELKGLDELKRAININPSIEACYVWELSRLSRIGYVLEELRNLFINKKINLICKQENIRLLDDDKKIVFATKMQFDMYKNMVENEGIIRTERILRGKKASYEKFKHAGGTILFGYTIDENKNYLIHPINGDIVRLMFNLYSTDTYSYQKIYDELISRGYDINPSIDIHHIISNRGYTGMKYKSKTQKYEHIYPQLIDEETFNICNSIAKKKANRKVNKAKNIYYAGRLIKCTHCGNTLVAYFNKQYVCKNFVEEKGCTCGDRININVIDSLAFHVADQREKAYMTINREEEINEGKNTINLLNQKINSSSEKFEIIKTAKRKELKKLLDFMNDKEFESSLERSLIKDRQAIEFEVKEYKNEIERIENYVINDNFIPNYFSNIQLTDKQRYDVVHKHIKEITVGNLNGSKGVKEIIITLVNGLDGSEKIFNYACKKKDKSKRLYVNDTELVYENDIPVSEVPIIRYLDFDEYIFEHIIR